MDYSSLFMLTGFMLAAYSVVANDAIQTLGTFLSSNAQRPWWMLWMFASSILIVVFLSGFLFNDGDLSFGRLNSFPEAGNFTWVMVIAPLAILVLTRYGIPVSTTFVILTAFNPRALDDMLLKSLVGYLPDAQSCPHQLVPSDEAG